MSLVTKKITLALVVLSLTLTGVHVANEPASASGIYDHYKFYFMVTGQTTITDPIQLFDQFSQLDVDFIYTLEALGLPAEKDGGPIFRPDLHYSLYLFQGQAPSVNEEIVATHQYGDVNLSVQNPVALMTPAQKNVPPPFQLPPANHFLCYDAFGPPLNQPVSLFTQFGSEHVDLLNPVFFCNPVEKHHAGVTYPILDPNQHLTCYTFNPPGSASAGVTIVDQFTFTFAPLAVAQIVCLPSIKNIPTPTEGSTWGRVKTIYR